ncbi:hypothetical protein CLU96_4463 [Chryseobacterium sp. 52]|nr:hypothetical protein CLU96_4463 [Chryseobacterium sp. 52]
MGTIENSISMSVKPFLHHFWTLSHSMMFDFNYKDMKKSFFKLVNAVNKKILPKLSHKDPNSLTKIEKGILGYRYFVLVNSLD